MNQKFERLHPRHRKALEQLFERNAGGPVEETFTPFPLTRESAKHILNAHRSDLFFGLHLGDDLVGFSMLRGWDEGYDIPFLGIFIDASHQSRGLGRRLMQSTLEYARYRAIPVIRLRVDPRNAPALQLYREVGFKNIALPKCKGTPPSHAQLPDSDLLSPHLLMEWTNHWHAVKAKHDR